MASISTHVLDGAKGGPMPGIRVEVYRPDAGIVARTLTDELGRAEVADGLAPGLYRIVWHLDGFVTELAATLSLDEDRRYHVPVLASGHSAVVYHGV